MMLLKAASKQPVSGLLVPLVQPLFGLSGLLLALQLPLIAPQSAAVVSAAVFGGAAATGGHCALVDPWDGTCGETSSAVAALPADADAAFPRSPSAAAELNTTEVRVQTLQLCCNSRSDWVSGARGLPSLSHIHSYILNKKPSGLVLLFLYPI